MLKVTFKQYIILSQYLLLCYELLRAITEHMFETNTFVYDKSGFLISKALGLCNKILTIQSKTQVFAALHNKSTIKRQTIN